MSANAAAVAWTYDTAIQQVNGYVATGNVESLKLFGERDKQQQNTESAVEPPRTQTNATQSGEPIEKAPDTIPAPERTQGPVFSFGSSDISSNPGRHIQ